MVRKRFEQAVKLMIANVNIKFAGLALLILFTASFPVQAAMYPEAKAIVLSEDSNIAVTFEGSDAGYNNLFGIHDPVYKELFWGHSATPGTKFDLGNFPKYTELVFFVKSPDGTFLSGPASRNPDNTVHAAITDVNSQTLRMGFEDMWNGGDRDYNDITALVTGNLYIIPSNPSKPDLLILPGDISFSKNNPTEGDIIEIQASIRNFGSAVSFDVTLEFYDGNPDAGGELILSSVIHGINKEENVIKSIAWDTAGEAGSHSIYVRIDPKNLIDESNKDNNKASQEIVVSSIPSGIKIISPTDKDYWQIGSAKTIQWSYTGNPGQYVQIELLKNGAVDQILPPSTALGTPIGADGIGSYTWKIPLTQTPGIVYQIRVTSTADSAYTDISQYFSIIGTTSSGMVVGSDSKGIKDVIMTFEQVSGTKIIVPDPVLTDKNGDWKQDGFLQGITYRVTPSDPASDGIGYIFKPFYLDFSGPSIELDLLGLQTLSGIDVSYAAGDVPTETWRKLYNDNGYRFVVVGGWGGRGKNDHAKNQLQVARCAGFKTAAYTYLSFEKLDQTGSWQIDQTLEAVGDKEKKYLSFVAVDVELYCDKYGNCWEVNVKPEDRTREAVKAVTEAGLKPIIYSSKYYWNSILGLSKVTEFNYLPLWNTGSGSKPSLQAGWVSYGGWTGSTGKQYVLDTKKQNVGVDLNVFDPSIFAETPSSPCVSVEPSTGKKTVYIDVDSGVIENLVAVNPVDISTSPPKEVNLYYGLFRFDVTGLIPGSSITLSLIYPDNPSKATKKYWKYGPTKDDPTVHWYSIPSEIKGNIQTIKIVDGELGDDDLTVNGKIKDDGGPSIDDIAPTTTLNLSGTLGNNSWFTSDVQVNLTATDNKDGSGVNTTEYSFNNTTWNIYTAPFNMSSEGIVMIYYRSVDNAGNIESTKNQTVKIDKTVPEVSINTPINGSYVLNQTVIVNWAVNDSVSGIASVTATVPNGTAINTATVGIKNFSVDATDNAGNQVNKTLTYDVVNSYTPPSTPGHYSSSGSSGNSSIIPAVPKKTVVKAEYKGAEKPGINTIDQVGSVINSTSVPPRAESLAHKSSSSVWIFVVLFVLAGVSVLLLLRKRRKNN